MKAHIAIAVVSAVAAFLLAPRLVGPRSEVRPEPVELNARTLDPSVWGKRFPAQFEGWRRADADPDPARGHAFSLEDRDESKPDDDPRWKRIFSGRPKQRPVPGGCLYCHASLGYRDGATTYYAARRWLDRPVGCIDCHDPETLRLRITRPFPIRDAPGGLRTLVCAQCHSSYYFAGKEKTVAYPWSSGWAAEQIEAYYDALDYSAWRHAETGAAVLEARHPQFEMYRQGAHARGGVACADCHMPHLRQGAIRITDHQTRRPSKNVENACLRCHEATAAEMRARIEEIRRRQALLVERAMDSLVSLLSAVRSAEAAGAPEAQLAVARKLQRRAQWRLDFASADRSFGFHAPQESARILAEAIDYARQGQVAAARATIVSAAKTGR